MPASAITFALFNVVTYYILTSDDTKLRLNEVLKNQDDDNRLTKAEFKKFLFPHLGDGAAEVIVHEAHEALDADYDGRVSQDGK